MILEAIGIFTAVVIIPSLWFADRILKREHETKRAHETEKEGDPHAHQRIVLQEAVKSAKYQLDKVPVYQSGDRARFADRVTAAEQALLNFEQRVTKKTQIT
jgi:hypothetical protein